MSRAAPHLVLQINGQIVDPSMRVGDGEDDTALTDVAETALRTTYCNAHLKDGETCPERATHVFFWPGRGESYQCASHTRRAQHIADVMGFHLLVYEVTPEGLERYTQMLKNACSGSRAAPGEHTRVTCALAAFRPPQP